jgi:hypothetical protein
MRKLTFGTKSDKWEGSLSVTVDMPSTIKDTDAIVTRYGSVERLIDRANAQWKVDAQTGMRKRSADEAVAYAAGYCDNGSKDTYVPKMSAEDLKAGKFTDAQIEIMRKAGMKV